MEDKVSATGSPELKGVA